VSATPHRIPRRLWATREIVLSAVATGLLLAGLVGAVTGARAAASAVWTTLTLLGLLYSMVTIGVALGRRRPWVEVIAWPALVYALLIGEPLTGAVIAVMLLAGGVLEVHRNRLPGVS
jgi:hypothetical protein